MLKKFNFSPQHFSPHHFSPHLGLDLGTARTRIWVQGQGLVLDEPSILAVNEKIGQVVAVGEDAAEMEGRVESQDETIKTGIKLVRPFQQAKVYDAEMAEALLRTWWQQLLGWRFVLSPVVMVSVAAASSQAQRQAVTAVLHDLGAREVYTMAQPLAAAIGAGVPIADASGTLITQFGAGVAEAALISLGSLVKFDSSYQAGQYLDQQLQRAIVAEYDLQVGQAQARALKHKLLLLNGSQQVSLVVGKSLTEQTPREIQVQAAQLTPTVQRQAAHLAQLVEKLLAVAPPELTADILDKGVLLAGGLAQLRGLNAYLTQHLGLPVAVVEKPQQAVVRGLGLALEHLAEFKQSLGYVE